MAIFFMQLKSKRETNDVREPHVSRQLREELIGAHILHEDKRLAWATANEVAWLSFTPTSLLLHLREWNLME